MAAALLSVLSGRIRRWKYTPKQLNNQQRGQHRRLGKAHGARDDPEAVSFRRARNAPWAALTGCIMPPNLFGHTTSGYKWGPHEVAYFVGKGETNGVVELLRLRGSERYGVCFDSRQADVAGVESSKTLSTSCERCQALSALFPIAGARAANTAQESHSDYCSDYKIQRAERQNFGSGTKEKLEFIF